VAVGCADPDASGPYRPTLDSLGRHEIPAWYEDGKVGIIIHWGPASVTAFSSRSPTIPAGWYHWGLHLGPEAEIGRHHLETYGADVVYDDLIDDFTASEWDPDAWIALFEEAGARYFILTTRHHDGFALWPSAVSGRDSGDLGPRRDLVGELFAAARRADNRVRPGAYYSIPEFFTAAPSPLQTRLPWPEWTSNGALAAAALFRPSLLPICLRMADTPDECQPFYKGPPVNPFTGEVVEYRGSVPMTDYATQQVQPQLRELIDEYRPEMIWCDLGGPESYFRSNESIAYYYNRAAETMPDGVVVNDRCGDETTHFDTATVELNGEFIRGEVDASVRGEVLIPLGFGFFYDTRDTEEDFRAPNDLVDGLVRAVAQNQNVLFGVGPRADGTIPDIQVSQLRAIGAWLSVNGEAIYGSRPFRVTHVEDVYFTWGAEDRLNVIALDWPAGGELAVDVPLELAAGSRVTLLGHDGSALAHASTGSRLTITLPPRESVDTDHAFVFVVEGAVR
jgi:alpha-L-fucosidase